MHIPALDTLLVHCGTSISQISVLPAAVDTEGVLTAIDEHLLSLRCLHITLNFQRSILQLAFDDVSMLSEAWPAVEELLIDVATVDGGSAGLESIIHFACCCPRLCVLRLSAMDL